MRNPGLTIINFTHKVPSLKVRAVRKMKRAIMVDGRIHSIHSGPGHAFRDQSVKIAERVLRRAGYDVFPPSENTQVTVFHCAVTELPPGSEGPVWKREEKKP